MTQLIISDLKFFFSSMYITRDKKNIMSISITNALGNFEPFTILLRSTTIA